MSSRKVLARSLVIATAVGGFTSLQTIVMLLSRRITVRDGARDVALSLFYWYGWALVVPLLAPFFARYSLSERPWRHLLYYCGVGGVASLGPATFSHILYDLAHRWASPSANDMRRGLGVEWFASFVMFWIISGIFQTVVARQKVRELQEQLAQAELQNLKSQLHPHFLFNTLHTISVLLRQDAEAANGVLVKLSELLRVSLDHARADQIPLQQELDFLAVYLSIEQTRFQERLRTSIAADGEARAALIPTLLLQPLVENAMKHGIAPRSAGGSLSISARRVRDVLELRVENDGAGLAADYSARKSRGCGIRNTEGRLRALCGSAARLELVPRDGGGVAVNISLPYRSS